MYIDPRLLRETRPVLGNAPQENLLGSTHYTPPATSWHCEILAQLATSLGRQMREGRPRVGVGRAQMRGNGGTGAGSGGGSKIGLDGLVSMQGLHSGAIWMRCMHREGSGSTRRGAPEQCKPRIGV